MRLLLCLRHHRIVKKSSCKVKQPGLRMGGIFKRSLRLGSVNSVTFGWKLGDAGDRLILVSQATGMK